MKSLQIYNANYGTVDIYCRNYTDAINELHTLAIEESEKYDKELQEEIDGLKKARELEWGDYLIEAKENGLKDANNWVKNAKWTIEVVDKSTDDWKYKTIYTLTNAKLKQLKKINLF